MDMSTNDTNILMDRISLFVRNKEIRSSETVIIQKHQDLTHCL